MSTTDEILAAVDSLPLAERREVAARIWASLPLDDDCLPGESDMAIIDQRLADIDAGKAGTIPIEEVVRRMHERLKRHG